MPGMMVAMGNDVMGMNAGMPGMVAGANTTYANCYRMGVSLLLWDRPFAFGILL